MNFLIVIFLIIMIHEFGHLIAAKWFKCKVSVFSIGFGRPLFKKKIKETVYQICSLLLGGYCELKDELSYSRSKYAFTNLKYHQKVIISLAGVFLNIVTGLIALLIGKHFHIYFLFAFGFYSLLLGLTNALPIPALDGSYPFFVLLEKSMGKKRAYAFIKKLFTFCFKIIMILNILSIPYLGYLLVTGKLM